MAGADGGARPGGVSRGDWLVYSGVLVLFLPLVTGEAWAGLDPRLSASLAFHRDGAAQDPWGNPWLQDREGRIFSAGPDGQDQAGAGDDLRLLPGEDWRLWLLARGGDRLLAALAVALGLVWEGARALAVPRRGSTAQEAMRVLPAAICAGALALAASRGISWLLPDLAPLRRSLQEGLWLDLDLALAATAAGLSGLALFAWRMTKPPAEAGDDAPPEPSSPPDPSP